MSDPRSIDKFSLFRIISFTLAGGDVIQTIPGTFALYKKSWVSRRLSPVCFFYAMARYMTILSLISNGIGFYGTKFTYKTCKPWYMLPNITAMLAGMAVQILVFIRTFAISGRSKYAWFGLGAVLLLGFPVQMFGIIYHRDVFIHDGGCKGKVQRPGEPDWNIVYYSAHMCYDLIACATATFFLVYSSRIQGVFNASKFVRRVLRNGLLYFIVVFVVNLWVVLEFAGVFITGASSTLPLAVLLIAVQHLILSTQRLNSDHPPSTDNNYSRSHFMSGVNGVNSGPPRFYSGDSTQQDVELQSAGIFVVTETSVHGRDDDDDTMSASFQAKNDKSSGPASKGSIPGVPFAA